MTNHLVVKSNKLIEARYNLSLIEQKIILFAVSKLDRNADKFNEITVDINEFTDLLDAPENRVTEIKNIIMGLRRKDIVINTKEKLYITGWLSSATFDHHESTVMIRFDDDLIPYLLQLKMKFTQYNLKNVINLKGKYSIRFYELMKQYEKIGSREMQIDEMRKMLFLENQYERNYDLEKKVIEPAIEEINKYTDLTIEYEKRRKGRKISHYDFKIKGEHGDLDSEEYQLYLEESYNIQEMKDKMGVKEENFNANQIISLYTIAVIKLNDEFEEDDIYQYINYNYIYSKEKKGIKNIYSYLKKALEEDFMNAILMMRIKNKQKK